MTDASYLAAKAAQCRYLADIAENLETRRMLDELAGEFERRAQELAAGAAKAAAPNRDPVPAPRIRGQ